MSSTLLEVSRAAHEEVEWLIVKDLQNEPATNKDRLFQSRRVRNMIDTVTSTTENAHFSPEFLRVLCGQPEFKGEIWGNYSYWGRRAFERHFREWRHQHGMRCLGIPKTMKLHRGSQGYVEERIQEKQGLIKRRPDLEEEYEDKEGNIYNKKTYTDLQRQGLI